MIKSKPALIVFVLCFILSGCSGAEKEDAEGETVENAYAVYDKLGIDISMPEAISGASDFEYSIIDENIGQVCFLYDEEKYYLKASMEVTTWDEMGYTVDSNGWCGTTLEAGDDLDVAMTGIEWANIEEGGGVVHWRWHGIGFFLLGSQEYGLYDMPPAFINEIARNSYDQPQTAEN